MSNSVIKVENLSKQYRLGEVGTGSLSHDINRLWHRARGKQDPFFKIGDENRRDTKAHSDYVWALKDINFDIEQGDRVGIIGRNGAGKSTLLKILSRTTSPTSGSIKIKGKVASLLEVGTGFHPDLSGRDNIFLNGAILGMTRRDIKSRFDEIVDFAGVERYIDTPVKRYSSGMYVRLAFAVAANLESDILIVDEVLAVGDAEFQKKCLGKMNDLSTDKGRTILFVSHYLQAIRDLCNQAILINQGSIEIKGNIVEVFSKYLDSSDVKTDVTFNNVYLEYASLSFEESNIIIKAAYNLQMDIDIPNLGFVIYNNVGSAVIGGNPILHKFDFEKEKFYTKGTIITEIVNPRLIEGFYTVSLWFGNSAKNYFEALNCLSFEVSNMVDIKYVNTSFIGSITPELKYQFY